MLKAQIIEILEHYKETYNLTIVFMQYQLIILHDGIKHELYYQDVSNITYHSQGTNMKLMFWLGENKKNIISILLDRKEVE